MTRDEAIAILRLPEEKAIEAILSLAGKAEKYDQLYGPSTPSGMIPPYLKPVPGKRKKPPGRKKGHEGVCRIRQEKADRSEEHRLDRCPKCYTPLMEPVKSYTRFIEDIPRIEKPEVTEHTLYGYWCAHCKKVVFPPVTDAFPNSMIGLRLVVLTAWLHYLVGVSCQNIVKVLSVLCRFNVSAGGLTMAWKRLALMV
jgi:transposase